MKESQCRHSVARHPFQTSHCFHLILDEYYFLLDPFILKWSQCPSKSMDFFPQTLMDFIKNLSHNSNQTDFCSSCPIPLPWQIIAMKNVNFHDCNRHAKACKAMLKAKSCHLWDKLRVSVVLIILLAFSLSGREIFWYRYRMLRVHCIIF